MRIFFDSYMEEYKWRNGDRFEFAEGKRRENCLICVLFTIFYEVVVWGVAILMKMPIMAVIGIAFLALAIWFIKVYCRKISAADYQNMRWRGWY